MRAHKNKNTIHEKNNSYNNADIASQRHKQ